MCWVIGPTAARERCARRGSTFDALGGSKGKAACERSSTQGSLKITSGPPAVESYATSSLDHHDAEPEEILEAEIVDEAEPANDTPPRVAEMIKSGAFDCKRALTNK